MKVVLTGGGTAGHILPNIALVPDLRARKADILYIGNADGMEQDICRRNCIPLRHCDSIKFDRGHMGRNLAIPFVLPGCVRKAKKILRDFGADVVFSKGGYVALPVVLAAKSLRIPIVCHESDASLGLSNRIAARYARYVLLADAQAYDADNAVVVGNPLREQLFRGNEEIVRARHRIPDGAPVLLIVGGSLGAQAINRVVLQTLDALCERYFVLHVVGKDKSDVRHARYAQIEYAQDIEHYLTAADVIVSRCGAGVSGEITALGKRVVYVPLPAGNSRGDQVLNARKLADRRLAILLDQSDLTPDTLVAAIERARHMELSASGYDRDTPAKIVEYICRAARESSGS